MCLVCVCVHVSVCVLSSKPRWWGPFLSGTVHLRFPVLAAVLLPLGCGSPALTSVPGSRCPLSYLPYKGLVHALGAFTPSLGYRMSLEAVLIMRVVAERQRCLSLLLCLLLGALPASRCTSVDPAAQSETLREPCYCLGRDPPSAMGVGQNIRSGPLSLEAGAHVCDMFYALPLQARPLPRMWRQHGARTDYHPAPMATHWGQCFSGWRASIVALLRRCKLPPHQLRLPWTLPRTPTVCLGTDPCEL